MNRAAFMEVNGAVYGGARQARRLRLPAKEGMLDSFRFGRHGYVLGQTMQMLPMGEEARPVGNAAPAAAARFGVCRALGRLTQRKLAFLVLLP